MENNIELQEMREQLASFKQQLASQKIINEQLMRRATAEKASKLKTKKNGILMIGLFAIIFTPTVFHSFGFPLYFVVYTAAMVAFSMIMTIIYHWNVDKADFMSGDLRSVATELKKLRRRYTQWYWIAVPMIIIFCTLFYKSSLELDINQEILRGLLTGAAIGGVIGALIGIRMNRNIAGLCDDIIKDIENN